MVVGVVGLLHGYLQLAPGVELVGGGDDAVVAADDGFAPEGEGAFTFAPLGGDLQLYADQFLAYLVERPAGRDAEEGAEGGGIGAHAAEEFVE